MPDNHPEGTVADVDGVPYVKRGGRWVRQGAQQHPGGIVFGQPRPTPAPSGYRAAGDGLEPIPGGPADRRRNAEPPSGYRWKPDGSLEEIPGGPADPNRPKPVKPMPWGAQKEESADLEILGTASTINGQLGQAADRIRSGKLNLSLFGNLTAEGRNFLGASDANSRNYASFRATLERMRNDSLRLNKGVQTEGDAIRAWNELFKNVNDEGMVLQRLGEIMALNDRAVALRSQIIDSRRRNYGLDDLDITPFLAGQPAEPPPPRPTAQERAARRSRATPEELAFYNERIIGKPAPPRRGTGVGANVRLGDGTAPARRPAPRRQAPAPADLSTMDEKDLERIARGG